MQSDVTPHFKDIQTVDTIFKIQILEGEKAYGAKVTKRQVSKQEMVESKQNFYFFFFRLFLYRILLSLDTSTVLQVLLCIHLCTTPVYCF